MLTADKILLNGQIVTLDETHPEVEALAIKAGKIVALGSSEEIASLKTADGTVIDLQGQTVVPGFTDAHVHVTATGLNMLGVVLNQASSVEEVLQQIRQRVEKTKPGDLILASGLDTNKFSVEQLPTRLELDRVAPLNPVFINRVDSHSCVINSRLLELLSIPRKISGIEADQTGQWTGLMQKAANSYVRNRVLEIIPDVLRKRAVDGVVKAALQVGITTIHALEGGDLFNDKDVEALIKIQDDLPIHLVIWYQTMDIDRVQRLGLTRVGGCIILDGSFTSRTAALSEDYSDDPGNKGILYYDQETVNRFVERAQRAGLQISMHVLGERAIEQSLVAYQLAQSKYPQPNLRHRLEHFELPTTDQIERAARLGIILSMQPAFEYHWGGSGMYGRRLGMRAKFTNPFKSILNAGGVIVGGSDSDVTPMNPLVGIQGAMTHNNPQERLSCLEALKLFTINPAYSVYEEDIRGSISLGKFADLTVLAENPLRTNPEEIANIEVRETIVAGKTIFKRG